jgi:flavorubredoxin
MAVITEIAPETYRISVFEPEIDLEFNHFLVRDELPLLFHTGYRRLFSEVNKAVQSLIDPARLRYISFSHFESDECGSLNDWLAQAPEAQPVCGFVNVQVNLNDFAIRPPRSVTRNEIIETGRFRFRFIPTPHVPHGWDAGVLFEETRRTLFCSDLFHQWGYMEPLTESSILDRARDGLVRTERSPLARYVPYTHHTRGILEDLARLGPQTLAVMHGSSFRGDGAAALRDLAEIWREALGPAAEESLAGKATATS